MSKFVDELVLDIRTNPQDWKRYGDEGLIRDDVYVGPCGNGSKYFMFWLTSVVDVIIGGKSTSEHMTWRDKCRLEEAFLWWMRSQSLEALKK